MKKFVTKKIIEEQGFKKVGSHLWILVKRDALGKNQAHARCGYCRRFSDVMKIDLTQELTVPCVYCGSRVGLKVPMSPPKLTSRDDRVMLE